MITRFLSAICALMAVPALSALFVALFSVLYGLSVHAASVTQNLAITVTPAQTFTYNLVTDFGAVAGNTSATDAALHAFNVEAQKRTRPPEGSYSGYPGYYANANKDNWIVLNIPAGAFPYTWNRFGNYIRHLKIIGAGSGLNGGSVTSMTNNIGSGSFNTERTFALDNDYFTGWSASPFERYGYLITTANAGVAQVTLKNTPSNASRFTVGRWVLIMSYTQQTYGYPPDMRYYDFAKVTGVNATTGVVSLDTPLQFTHRSDRPYAGTLTDGPAGTPGPASIVPIDTPDHPIAEWLETDGIRVPQSANWADTGCSPANCEIWQFSGVIDGSAKDLWLDNAMGFTQMRNFTVSNSKWGTDESDKVIGTLVYLNDAVDASLGHNGQLMWHVMGGHLGLTSVASRHAIYEGGALIDGMLDSGDFNFGIQLDVGKQTVDVLVNGVTFAGRGNANNAPINGPSPTWYEFPVGGAGLSLPNGNGTSRLAIARSGLGSYGTSAEFVAENWGDGDQIRKNGNLVAGATISVITADVNNIYVDATGTTFNGGDIVGVARVGTVTVQNSVGQNTGDGWDSPNIRYPSVSGSISNIVWSGNAGN